MLNDIVTPNLLSDFPGSPFPESVIDAAVESIRNEAGWHIAPVIQETVTLDAQGGAVLMLPTLRPVSVTAVRDVSDPLLPVVLTGWRLSKSGMLFRALGWPIGFGTVEVDLTHGHDYVPSDLLAVVAERCQALSVNGSVAQQSAGPFSVTYRAGVDNSSPRLAPYMLPPRQ